MTDRRQQNNTLVRDIVCDDFVNAVELIQAITPLAEDANHHPDILLHDYKYLTITLTTHDAWLITQKDYDLATQIDAILAM